MKKKRLNEDGMTTGDIASFTTSSLPIEKPSKHKKIKYIKLKYNPKISNKYNKK